MENFRRLFVLLPVIQIGQLLDKYRCSCCEWFRRWKGFFLGSCGCLNVINESTFCSSKSTFFFASIIFFKIYKVQITCSWAFVAFVWASPLSCKVFHYCGDRVPLLYLNLNASFFVSTITYVMMRTFTSWAHALVSRVLTSTMITLCLVAEHLIYARDRLAPLLAHMFNRFYWP